MEMHENKLCGRWDIWFAATNQMQQILVKKSQVNNSIQYLSYLL